MIQQYHGSHTALQFRLYHRVVGSCVLGVVVLFLCVQPVAAQFDTDHRIRKVDIQGNQAYPEIVLLEVLASQPTPVYNRWLFWKRTGMAFSEIEVRRDVVRLERFYQRRGFPRARVQYLVDSGRKKLCVDRNREYIEIRLEIHIISESPHLDRFLSNDSRPIT